VSRKGDRDGERFVSPPEQGERIRAECERDDLEIVGIIEEVDVSGGTPLGRRLGLRQAVERIEAGEAEVLVVAYSIGSSGRLGRNRRSWSGSKRSGAACQRSTWARSAPTRRRAG
jgi:hypothetical protein